MHPDYEQERLSALKYLDILDTAAEPEFDDLVTLAVAICDVPMSMISLIDADRQWFKAARGTSVRETPRSTSVCSHALQHRDLFTIPDAKLDDRFASEEFHNGAIPWRFYAGFPLRETGGYAIGTLCVMDERPRQLTKQQKVALRVLADQVTARLELRASRKRLEEAHRETRLLEQRFQLFMDSGPFVSYLKDAEGRMLYCNLPLAKRFNLSRQFMLGKTDRELWPEDLAEQYRKHDLEVLSGGGLSITEEQSRNEDGSHTVWRSYKFPCTSDGEQPMLGGVSIDITEQLAKEQELIRIHKELRQANLLLEQLATKDALTGLPLRQIYEEDLRVAFREARQTESPLTLLLLDIDNFKRHNDTFGHSHGDQVLKAVAGGLRSQIRPTDLITRFGGEEFAIALRGATAEQALDLSERLLATIRQLRVEGQSVTLSIGIAEIGQEGTTDGLLAQADEALYQAKRDGKDRALAWRERSSESR